MHPSLFCLRRPGASVCRRGFFSCGFLAPLLALVLSLSACGGGGGSGTTTTPATTPPTPVADTTPPVLTLQGAASLQLLVGSTFSDPGARASDDRDGDLSARIQVSGSVNTAQAGRYVLVYEVRDAAGNLARAEREVRVLAPGGNSFQFRPDGMLTIGAGLGGFTAPLEPGGRFSRDHDHAGDIDGDGIADLVVGARSDDDGAEDAGAVYILFLNADGSVRRHQKISMLEGGFTGPLAAGNFFGYGVAGIGDYDGDSVPDIAVSAPVPPNTALYVLFLTREGRVKAQVRNPGIPGTGLSPAGDLDRDGRIDLIASDPTANDGGPQRGAIELLFLSAGGQVQAGKTVRISATRGGMAPGLADYDQFGGRAANVLGDLDGNGDIEVAVGAFMSDAGRGAIWILSLDPQTFAVRSQQKIGAGHGGFSEPLPADPNPNGTSGAQFGHALAATGDLNGDGIGDLLTGANQYNEGYAYLLFLNRDKTVKAWTRINNSEGGFPLRLEAEERFSRSLSVTPAAGNNGRLTLNVGGGAGGTGTLYRLHLKSCPVQAISGEQRWADGQVLATESAASLETCVQKAFERGASQLDYLAAQGQCRLLSGASQLASAAGSIAYQLPCPA